MAINTKVVKNYQTAEYGKFVELLDSKYPSVSVVRLSYPDKSNAFPSNSAVEPLSSVDIYPKFGVLSYITNFDDLSITLSANDVTIGAVELKDGNSGLRADVVEAGEGLNALRVISQDLESTVDDVTIGDKQGNKASINPSLSALKVQVVNTDQIPNKIAYADSSNLDAFGRLRVSNPKTLVDAKHLYDKLPLLFAEKLSGTATSTFSANDSMVVMSTNAAGSFVIRQTKYHFNYQPGKSLQAFFTGKLHPQTGIIKRMGLFQSLSTAPATPTDGIYLEVTDSDAFFKITKTQGIPHNMSFPRSAWNVDKLDGTGISGVTVNLSAAQIFVIDYEWLSLGRVRFGFMQSGKTYYAHYVDHINDLDRPYITSPNQPIRYEIVQTGATPGSMHHICSTVMVEGGEEDLGKPLSVSDSKISNIDTSYKALLAIRLKNVAHDSCVVLKSVEVLNETNNPGLYDVILNPTFVSTPFVWSDLNSAAIQYSTGGAVVSGGHSLMKGFLPGGIGGTISTEGKSIQAEIVKLGIDIDDTPDVVVLAAKAFDVTAKVDARGLMNLLERS